MVRKRTGRAYRFSEAQGQISSAKSRLEDIKNSIDEYNEYDKASVKHDVEAGNIINLIEDAKSEFENLKEEVENWRDNMQGTNLEQTDKYQRLEQACDDLDSIISDCESAISDLDWLNDDDLDSIGSSIEQAISSLETVEGADVDFPTMYG